MTDFSLLNLDVLEINFKKQFKLKLILDCINMFFLFKFLKNSVLDCKKRLWNNLQICCKFICSKKL